MCNKIVRLIQEERTLEIQLSAGKSPVLQTKLTLYNISDNLLARNMDGGISVNRLIRRKIDGGKPAPSSGDFESTSSDFGGKIPKAFETTYSFSRTVRGDTVRGANDCPKDGKVRATANDEVITLAIEAFRQCPHFRPS
jgi:hypothetical protein